MKNFNKVYHLFLKYKPNNSNIKIKEVYHNTFEYEDITKNINTIEDIETDIILDDIVNDFIEQYKKELSNINKLYLNDDYFKHNFVEQTNFYYGFEFNYSY